MNTPIATMARPMSAPARQRASVSRGCLRARAWRRIHAHAAGFTLVELAMVLVILALLGGSLLVPLASRIEARDRQVALERLRDIQSALTGFAIIHGRLPCPSTETDPADPRYGVEDAAPCNFAVEGRLPWRSLALPATDPWGSTRLAPADGWAGYWRYRVDPAFTSAPVGAATAPTGNLQIRSHDGSRITTTDSQAVAIVYSTGPNRQADGLNASYSAAAPSYQAGESTADFDDLLAWLGRPLLIARVAQAGRL
ncbi:type II secretion system protein [Thauera sp.]|jgi:prepilin-type N-terminal cleavage/methylation domain-containing protein|uniref:type II secretion system protein n=1 Tax=Thauera sp. TaxID=1905334 RepID=UPI002A362CEB|nr:type II secretion system protein [Thauera sp.]MDX9885863.1 type II secretion system protein [Thauera sp.]